MVSAFEQNGCSQLGVEEVPKEETEKYGIVNTVSDSNGNDTLKVEKIVEKPRPEEASSNLAVVGRYILTPMIFDLLERTERGAGGEIQLTDAISALLQHEDVCAFRFDGKRYDCGSKLGYLKASVDYGLQHAEIAHDFHDFLASLDR